MASSHVGFTQDVQQVSPFFLPRVIVAPGTYYILTQGSSRFLESKFNISPGILTDSSIVIYEFFPSQGAFKVVARSGFVRHFYGATYYKDRIIIAGGYNASGVPTNTVYEFNLNTRRWNERTLGMLQKRAEFALEICSNKLYAVYGDDRETLETFNEATGKWQVVPLSFSQEAKPLKKVRSSVAIDNNIYLFADGGDFQVLNVSTSNVSKGVQPPAQISYFSTIVYNRKIYMAAGADKSGLDYNVYVLNTVDNSWQDAGRISVDLCGAGLVCHGRMLIFVGGSSTTMFEKTNPSGSIFIYRPMY
ncbi:MAG: kelch repeat-containing protein [Bacteroidales bacterium]